MARSKRRRLAELKKFRLRVPTRRKPWSNHRESRMSPNGWKRSSFKSSSLGAAGQVANTKDSKLFRTERRNRYFRISTAKKTTNLSKQKGASLATQSEWRLDNSLITGDSLPRKQ